MSEETVVRDADYFMQHPAEFDAMSDEDQHAFMFGGKPQGETKSEAPPDLTEAREAIDSPVVQAKDGKNIIPYSELEATREKVTRLEQMAQEQAALISDLRAAKELDAETGGTEAQDAVVAEYEGEYPELMDDIKPFLEKMVAGLMDARVKGLEDKVLQPIRDNEERAIIDIGASPEFSAWMNSQPCFARAKYEEVAASGTAGEVVELLDAYRKDMPMAKTASTDINRLAEEKIAKIKSPVPSSLSDMPGATAAHHDETEAMMDMSSLSLVEKFNHMTPDKIEEVLSRSL